MADVIEKGFATAAKGIDGILGATITAVNRGDKMAKHAELEFLSELAQFDNVDFEIKASLIGIDKPMKVNASMPIFALANLQQTTMEEVNLDMSMDVSDHQEASTAEDSQITAKGTAHIGIGPIGASVSISASIGVHASQKRSTDQRSHVGLTAKMSRTDPPEGVQLIVDSCNVLVSKTMEMNMKIIEGKVQQMQADVEAEANKPPEVEKRDTGDGSDTGKNPAAGNDG